MTDKELDALKKQIEDAQKAIIAEEERRKKVAESGGVDFDTSVIEEQLDDIIVNTSNEVKLLERLNQVSDMTYKKLEEISLNLLQLMSIGMPLLEKANKG